LEPELILERIDRRHIVRVARVDEHSRCDQHPGRIELFDGQSMLAGLIEDPVDVVILVDDHHRDVPVSSVRDRDRRAL